MKRLITTAFLTLCINTGTAAMTEPLTDIRPYAVTLSVPETAAMAAWYETVLGFTPIQSKTYPEFQTEVVFLEREGFRVELIRDGNAQSGPVRPDAQAHTSFPSHLHSLTVQMSRKPSVMQIPQKGPQVLMSDMSP